MIRAKLNNDRVNAVEIGIKVAELKEQFVQGLNEYLMENITFPLGLGEKCGFQLDYNSVLAIASFEAMIAQGSGITAIHVRSRTAPIFAGQFPELCKLFAEDLSTLSTMPTDGGHTEKVRVTVK